MTNTIESRIQNNKHFGGVLRRRLESRHGEDTAVRKTLNQLSDTDLVNAYLANQKQNSEHAKKQAKGEVGE